MAGPANFHVLTGEPNSRKRSSRWAFILTGQDADLIETSPMNGIEKMEKKSGKPFKLYIGPIEPTNEVNKHRYCLLHFTSTGGGDSKTKGQVKELIKEILPDICFDICCKFLTCSIEDYINFCWKTNSPLKNVVECQMKDSLKKLKDSGYAITLKSFKQQVIKDYGPVFYYKNKNVADVILTEMELFNPGRKVPFEIKPEENFCAAYKTVSLFNKILLNNLYKNMYKTSHKWFNNIDLDDVGNFATLWTILPLICDRWEGVDDLPALYLWGKPCTGKSHMFNSSPAYKKFPMDAQGVSRYKLNGCEAGWLFDDMFAEFLDEPSNSGTLRQLTLGGSTTVKIAGDTQDIQGWVVITSNHMPIFLKAEPPSEYQGNWQFNSTAWKRRFLTIEMTEQVDIEPVKVDWKHNSSLAAAKTLVKMYSDRIKSELLQEKLRKYVDFVEKKIEPSWIDLINKSAHIVNEWVDNTVGNVPKPNAYQEIMKNKIE